MKRSVIFEQNATSPTQFKYSAQTNPSALVSTPATAPQSPDNSLEIVISIPASSDYTVKSITFAATGLMQNADNLDLSVYDPNDNEWSFTNSGTTFTLSPAGGFTLSNTVITVEIAGFVTPAEAGAAKVSITENLVSFPAGGGALTIGIFPLGFFFDGLGAWVQDDSVYTPVAEVSNGTVVQLQWDSSASESQINIYQSGVAGFATPPDIGYWNSPPLTEDTVFTVAATQAGAPPLTQCVAVTVSNPDIPARSLTATGAVTAGSVTGGSISTTGELSAGSADVTGALSGGSIVTTGTLSSGALTASSITTPGALSAGPTTVTGAFTMIQGWGTPQQLPLPTMSPATYGASGESCYIPTADGFVFASAGGWTFTPKSGAVNLYVTNGIFTGSASGTPVPYSTPQTFLFPVTANTQFQITMEIIGNSATSSMDVNYFFYIPFGQGVANLTTCSS